MNNLYYDPITPRFALIVGVCLLWFTLFLYIIARYGAIPALYFVVTTLVIGCIIILAL